MHYYITIYLFHIGKKVIAFEEANAAFSNTQILDAALLNCAPEHHKIASALHLIDYRNTRIKRIICDRKNQSKECLEHWSGEREIEDFSIADTLLDIDRASLANLYQVFGVKENLHIENDSVVLFTQHFMGLDMLSIDEQHDIYAAFIDYFLNGKKYILNRIRMISIVMRPVFQGVR